MNTEKKNLKARVEKGFGNLARAIARHPWVWFIGCTLLVAALASQLVHIKKDTSVEGFLKKGDPTIALYNDFKDIFGKDEVFVISIAVDDIFNQAFIDELRQFHLQLEDEVPYVEKVDSLINARYTYGEDDTMYIEDLLPETLPDDPEELQKLKDYTWSSEAYNNWLISEDREMIVISVRLSAFMLEENSDGELKPRYIEDKELDEAYVRIREISQQYQGSLSDRIDVVGSIPVGVTLSGSMEHDFSLFTGLAVSLIGILLYVIFRRASGVIMPLLIMALGIVTTISLMAIQNVPLQVSTSILPSFLLAVCVGDSIHLLTIFYRQYDTGVSKIEALVHAMEHTALPIFFTSITTAAGLASFAFSDLFPVSSLGYYGALGSIIAFLLTVLILPTLIAILPLKRKPVVEHKAGILQPILAWCAHVSIKHAKGVVVSGLLVFGASVYFVSQLSFSHAPLHWLPPTNELRMANDNYEEHIGGSLALEIMFDTGKERGVNDYTFMQTLAEVQQELSEWQEPTFKVAKVIAVTDIIRESNRALNNNDQSSYAIPSDSELISQELFLVELDKPDDLYHMIDKRYQTARMTVLFPMVDAIHIRPFMERVDAYLENRMAPLNVSYNLTGIAPILGSTFAKMLYSTAESYLFAGIAITVMMILLIGSLKLGLVSMIPSLLPILVMLTFVQLQGISLDILTMLVGSIAIGLTVDDNVHFMHGFRRLYHKTGNPAYAIKQTLLSSGRAMLITSIVLSTGFFIYTQSEMLNMKLFGLVTGFCIILALFATFLLAPALMMLTNKTHSEQQPEH